MRIKRQILCAVTALTMLCALPARAEVTASNMADDGQVRVYLKSLSDPASVQMTLAGEYAFDADVNFRAAKGTEMTLRGDGSRIWLTIGKTSLNLGKRVTLTRCAGSDGFYLPSSGRKALYQGDLTLTSESGRLKPILTIAMEDYLLGVVAYEMSDSFPREALKAQAVAARTYAMCRKNARKGKNYDVTDTTSDQVFKGFRADAQNVISAVRDTAGVVGTYHGSCAVCYYTASNGGQISTPSQIWGGKSDDGYIVQKDDPYDLENARSLVNGIYVPADADQTNAVWQLLERKLDAEGHDQVRGDAIVGIALSDPAFEGSRMFRSMDFEMRLSVRDKLWQETDFSGSEEEGEKLGYRKIDGKWCASTWTDWTELAGKRTVRLGVYTDLKKTLGLALNGGDYEIPSVTEKESGYRLEMRRFGHGCGMSQRGAQTMAGTYGKSWQEIFAFYYPGLTLEKIAWQGKSLPAWSAYSGRALIAENSESLKAGESRAAASLQSGSLNVRSAPSTEASIVAKIANGGSLTVCGEAQDGWVRVRGALYTGFVRSEYLKSN